jgi:GNAT superfamily N-acetyltransferase
MDVRYSMYSSPRERPVDPDILLGFVRAVPDLALGLVKPPLVPYIISLPLNPDWPKALQDWHTEANTWIPADVFSWWQGQFRNSPHLCSSPREWWLWRTLRLACAWQDNLPIGALALVVVPESDRVFEGQLQGGDLFFEPRGGAVALRWRRLGIGRELFERVVAEALSIGGVPTFIATSNPDVVEGLTKADPLVPDLTGFARYGHNGDGLACWGPCDIAPCNECPRLPGRSFWIPTHQPV